MNKQDIRVIIEDDCVRIYKDISSLDNGLYMVYNFENKKDLMNEISNAILELIEREC